MGTLLLLIFTSFKEKVGWKKTTKPKKFGGLAELGKANWHENCYTPKGTIVISDIFLAHI